MIRRATPADLDRILRLDRACFSRPWPAEAWRAELAPAVGEGLVLLVGEPPVGFACAPIALGRCELRRIGVEPGSRGRGFGRDLLSRVVSHARARECGGVELEVGASNRHALALYEAAGFRVVGRRPGYYCDPPDDALLMTLRLGRDRDQT